MGIDSDVSGSEMGGQVFAFSGPEVVHETVDEETIVVNLETGSYYDLNPSGAFIWSRLEARQDVGQIVTAVCARYELDRATGQADVEKLVAELLQERLIVPIDPAAAAGNGRNGHGADAHVVERAAASYSPPALGKYTDMQELLLLDPVHEVDDTGWPRTA